MTDESFGRVRRRHRAASGLTQPQLAERVHVDQSAVSRWENDRAVPARALVERLDEVLGVGGDLVRSAFPAEPALLPRSGEPVTSDHVDELRRSIANLVQLDGRYGGAELVSMAVRMFTTATARLASGMVPASLETDFTATVAELGEVAGWLAFDAQQHDKARALNLEALHLARLAGDTGMELFLLGNMALLAQEAGQDREALRTVELMERFRLSPRVRVMAALRRARAAAALGDERSFTLIRRAQAEVDSSVQSTDPEWAWWVDRRELTAHEGGMWRAIGRPDRAVDCYAAALEGVPDRYRWAAYLGGANLVAALVEVRSWSEAERAATQVANLAAEVTSARAASRLADAAAAARRRRAPHSLEGLLSALAGR
ncbi:helix-turn-helix transcriptional regulator [Saccharopolyspora sp. TS4A08]|uniref:Helix-turn-helix transcriptional regulator n=1 Tax=Saccharopolyspora ipomoeae TaxID=3042027 RepID=A0ABT6PS50_9PSEU|nr:helix-turn-helix transcriptional regulator [Saccharopolyspora sp. TS4A08]MDI2030835.1 helix-turn-helix transcriptional regulator [Saccharopolyspora sp. TS4A08]